MAASETTGRIPLTKPDNGSTSGVKDSGSVWTNYTNANWDTLSSMLEYIVCTDSGVCVHEGKIVTNFPD